MEARKLLIAEGTEDFRMALADTLRGAYRVRTCADGVEALESLRTFKPDILVLDLMLPGMDGISLLQTAAAAGLRPMVLATTRFLNDYVLEAMDRLGVGYVMVKPCDVRATVARIGDLTQRIDQPQVTQPDYRSQITNTLRVLGVATKLKGYQYLREAVLLIADDPNQAITKELYPAIAKNYGADKNNVERAIRSAIDKAWKRRDEQIWRLYFIPDETGQIQRPTNAEFITRLADGLKMDAGSAAEEPEL